MKPKNSTRLGLIAASAIAAIAAVAPATALAATADLSLSKADGSDPAPRGAELSYTLTVSNAGPDTANGVTVVDRLPARVVFGSAASTQGTCDLSGRKVACELGELANGATARVTLRVTPRRDGQISNKARASTVDTDSRAENNSDTETTTVVGEYTFPSRCGGKIATIVGTPGDDELVGTDKRDVIVGLAGDDRIDGLGRKDILCGFGGDDTLKGRGDDDKLRGGGGNDALRGGGAEDNLRGGTGSDLVRGGTDDDELRGIGGDDELRGIGGLDVLRGGGGDDKLRGGGGDDACRGGSGRDRKRSC